MSIDFQKVADAIEKSPREIKDLMFSAELGDKIGGIAETNKLEEEVALRFIDEVGYVILDLKSRSTFFDSLVEIGIDKDVANTITKEVELKIFSELDKIKNKIPEKQEQIIAPPPPKPTQNNVGTSFEQIILNQARAMQPARPQAGTGGSMNYESGIMNGKNEPPNNLPTEIETPIQRPIEREEEPPINKALDVPNYARGSDPYREPVE